MALGPGIGTIPEAEDDDDHDSQAPASHPEAHVD